METELKISQEEFDRLPFIHGDFNLSYYLLNLIKKIDTQILLNVVSECRNIYFKKINEKPEIYSIKKEYSGMVYFAPSYKVYERKEQNKICVLIIPPDGDCGLLEITKSAKKAYAENL